MVLCKLTGLECELVDEPTDKVMRNPAKNLAVRGFRATGIQFCGECGCSTEAKRRLGFPCPLGKGASNHEPE